MPAATNTPAPATATPSGVPCTDCEYYSGTLSRSRAGAYQPHGTYYCGDVTGTHNGWLRCPARRFLLALAAVLPARPPAVPSAAS
jgi:hypothetical protein